MTRLVSLAILLLSASSFPLNAAAPRLLFPDNLHLTRQIDDPVGRTTVTIDEYCSGNRMVSVTVSKTVVADYSKQEITEIDREAGTYSVSRFDELARAADGVAARRHDAGGDPALHDRWEVTPRGLRATANRSVDYFEYREDRGSGRRVEVGVDRNIKLSREAVEVLIGAAYPNPLREEHEPVLRAARSTREDRSITTTSSGQLSAEDTPYALPLILAFTYSESGQEITFRSTVTRVGTESVPADAVLIPAGAKRVESRAATVQRELQELDGRVSATTAPEK